MFAVGDKAVVDRAKLLEVIKEDQAKPNPEQFGSGEAREFESDMARVMPQSTASDISRIFRALANPKSATDSAGTLVGNF